MSKKVSDTFAALKEITAKQAGIAKEKVIISIPDDPLWASNGKHIFVEIGSIGSYSARWCSDAIRLARAIKRYLNEKYPTHLVACYEATGSHSTV